MRQNRVLTWTFAIIMLLTPVLSACQRGKPAPAATAAAGQAAAGAASATSEQAAAGSAAPSTAAPVPTRTPLPPIIVEVTPETGQEQALSAPVTVKFDQPMDPASTKNAFSIEPKVQGDVAVTGDELTFTPRQPLERGAQYQIKLDSSAASAGGLKLQEPVSFKFATVGYLEVTNTQPADKTSDVAVDAKITVSFNRPVVPITGVNDQSKLPTPLVFTPTVEGSGEWLNTGIYQFTPKNGLAASTDYTATVKAGLADTTGGLLAEDYVFAFHTTDPAVKSWYPGSENNLAVDGAISVTFSMAMEPASTQAAFSLVDAQKKAVAGTYTWSKDGTVMGFKPDRMLGFGAGYQASVAASARPANGQGSLRGEAKKSYQTISLPKITSTEPSDGDQQADPTGGITFQFASPMVPSQFITGTYTIVPKPTQVYTNYNEYENSLFLMFEKQPATAYTITLSGRLADRFGNTLGKDYVLHFSTRDYDPILQLSTPGQLVGTFNAYTTTQAFISYLNVPQIQFGIYKVADADFIALTGRNYWEVWDKFSPQRTDLVHGWATQTTAARNKAALLKINLDGQDGKQLAPGMYFFTMSGPSSPGEGGGVSARQLMARTDLNVTLKTEQEGALAWVTDLKSGLPVAGVKVRFVDGAAIDREATTDKDGIARIDFPSMVGVPTEQQHHSWDPLIALATGPNGQFGVASNNWEDGISAWNFNLPGGGSQQPFTAYVYTDRPIYRPGQTVYWKAIVRRDDDARYTLPSAGLPVTVTIQDDRGNEVFKQSLTLDALGTANGKFALGLDAATGYYNLGLQVENRVSSDELRYGVGFQVAEYRKPEYEVSATTDRPAYVQGQQVNVTAQASYFFGGPVKKGKVHWTLISNDFFFSAPDAGDYSFSDWDWYEPQTSSQYMGTISEGDGLTDDQGRFTFSVPADVSKYALSQRFTFDVNIQDVNGQTVATQAETVVHRGQFYIGLHPQSYVAAIGERTGVDVLTLDTEAKPQPKTDVTLVFNQVTWYSVREQSEDGRYYWTTKAKTTPVYTTTVTTSITGTAAAAWTPTDGGQYKVTASGRDAAGHAIGSAAYIWVSGKEYVSWRQDNNDRIQLIADKDQYKVGDTAELLVASPYQTPVKALLSIERNHVLSYRIIDIQGNSDLVRVPITADFTPDVFVSLMLVKGMDSTSPAPSFKLGLAQLKVSVADKALKVVLTPAPSAGVSRTTTDTLRVGPRDTVTWTVSTLDAAGKPIKADVSLALIDKAVLSLASDNSGTLMDRFYSQRALGVRTAATLVVNVDRVVAQLAKGGKGGGGGGGGMGLDVRQEFPDIAFWSANVSTDADGKAQVAVTLPDNLTTWTMDARAVTADTLVGQTKLDIIATKDLMVRPVLPRFFVEGDQAEIGAVIQNNTQNALDVTLDMQPTGLKVTGSSPSRITVQAESTYKAVWPVTVDPGVQEAKVLMSARGGTLADAVQMTLPVYHYTSPEVTGTSGQLSADESRLELVRLPADADPSRGGIEVKVESSLAAGMTGGLTYLEHYPYECVEQTMSRFLPNVVSYQALKKLGLSRPDLEAKLPQQVGIGLQRIYARQHVDGGWGWWQNDDSVPSITAYVVFGLARAKAAGFAVDDQVLERGTNFLRRNLKAPADLNQWEANQQAYTLYAMAEAGAPEPNRVGAMFEAREKLSLYAKGYLALAVSLVNDEAAPARIKSLLAEISSKAITSATATHWEESWTDYWNMNTDTRTTSVLLDVLARLDPKNSLAPNSVRWLMTARNGDRWETTQENAWAIISLTDWMAATGELEGSYSWQVTLNGGVLGQGGVTPSTVGDVTTLQADIAKLLTDQTNGLMIQRSTGADQTGKGQLYYTVHLETYLPVDKLQPMDRGVTISREYRMADCVNASAAETGGDQASQQDQGKKCPTVTQARVGDVLSVKLNIVVPQSLNYVVVEDPLPAGLEAIDTSLRTTSATASGPEVSKSGDGGEKAQPLWDWWWTPTHTDLRDEKVALFATDLEPGSYEFTYQVRASLPGRFLTLPPTASEMYFPEVWGRGAGSVFQVTE